MLLQITLTLSRLDSPDIKADALDFLARTAAISKGYRIAYFKANYLSHLVPTEDIKYIGKLITLYAEPEPFLWELSLHSLTPAHRKFFELPEYKLNRKDSI